MSKTTNPDKRNNRTNRTNNAGRSARLRKIRLGDIRINPRAQREFNQAWALSILGDFDPDKFQVPTVNVRDGVVWMVDGQHGTWACRQWLGDDPTQTIECWVHDGLTEEEEADLFLSLNNKKAISPLPKFRAGVTAGRPAESDIDRIVRAQGCVVTGNKSPGAIRAVSALEAIYRDQGAATLSQTVATIRDAYGDEGYEVGILRGLALVLARYSDIDSERLVARLRSAAGGSKGLINRAKMLSINTGQSKAQCTAAAIVETYNRGRGGKKLTPWWRTNEAAA